MSFLLIALAALAALGLLAALLSVGDNDDTPVNHGGHDCASCMSHDDGSCKIACLMEEHRKSKARAADVEEAPAEEESEGGADEGRRPPMASVLLLLSAALLASSCSPRLNTGQARFWHSFHTRYNTYFNASQAFIEGCEEQEQGNRDDYTRLLPLYAVGNPPSQTLGARQFDRTIEKTEKAIRRHSIKRRPEWNKQRRKTKADIEWLNRREYNPFLWRAWLLLGKAQFYKGQFEEGAATFGYMARLYPTQPVILARARAWQAKCYAELGWRYETEDLMVRQRRDGIPPQAVADWDFTLADHYLRTGQYAEASDWLSRCIRHERRRRRKARLWFILGQVEQRQGNGRKAFEAYRHVIRLQPPYDLEFQARIAQTRVTAATDARGMVRKLQRMASADKNKDFLGQIHYAIGNIHLAQHDTLAAIASYEEGHRRFVRRGAEQGALLLQLAQIYWQREAYADAQRCYGEAVKQMDATLPEYPEATRRSALLDQLVPQLQAAHWGDSLQTGRNDTVRAALLSAAVLMKDKVGHLPLARRMFRRLVDCWPDAAANDLAWYHLYLMDLREGRQDAAAADLRQLQQHYPQSEWTQLLSSPYYVENQRIGQHLEDSLYAATYAAFCQDRYAEVAANVQWSTRRFPRGAHRPKFLFVSALMLLHEGQTEACAQQMQQVTDDYPDSEVSPLAAHILRGLRQGRRPQGVRSLVGDIWQQHTAAALTDSAATDTLSLRRDVRFAFVLAFPLDSVNQNQLLYELARHNFTVYLVRNFEITVSDEGPVHRLTVSGFRSYDEALQYARRLDEDPRMAERLKGCRRVLVSEDNLPLLGTRFSYDDYDRFYQETIAPVQTDTHPLLNRPETIVEKPTETDDDADGQPSVPPRSATDQPVVIDFDDDFYR